MDGGHLAWHCLTDTGAYYTPSLKRYVGLTTVANLEAQPSVVASDRVTKLFTSPQKRMTLAVTRPRVGLCGDSEGNRPRKNSSQAFT